MSDGRPAGILDFAYDDTSGFYADASTIGLIDRLGQSWPGLQVDAGYARRLTSGTSLDVGIAHSRYSYYSGSESGRSYTEIYAGIARGALSSHIFLSPHYFTRGLWTAYGEVDGSVSPAPKWSLDGHVGLLLPLREGSTAQSYQPDFDWRIGVSRSLGRLSLHAAWSDGSPGHDYLRDRQHSRSALVLGATLVL